ncbi:ABC transporter permease [Streptomyces sp. SCUT-3]|uniref:ABC transporter permease n=1 Tax=Streptomyces sp. SCUT-3 TaxID=2684469 RepID=UPI000CA6B85B|nr:ABC transporter permease [Streptomyces sp. SCUT-3]PLW71265.1 sugar ABC transporter permease [Streptomyces sp. DJ]QMV22046.1 ABC transporter permease [Streptomyces sp. SCUT-3]
MKKIDKERLILAVAAPVLAVAFAMLLSSAILLASGRNPVEPYALMVDYAVVNPDVQVLIVNRTTTYYLAALAVAVGFRMNLFNIGVDGQYRLAAMLSAAVGTAVPLPGALRMVVIVVTAMLVGAAWAGIAGILKTTRGVSEVVSTIMLNAIATSLIAYLLQPSLLGKRLEGSNDLTTGELPESAWLPGIPTSAPGSEIYGFIVVAVLLGIGYWFLLNRTRFGFDLRAAGASESAAAASGVNGRRMVLTSILLSGALAGLTGMPLLLGEAHEYNLAFPAGVGFTGITIALLGRNNPVGMAVGALLLAFLKVTSQTLDSNGYVKEIAEIMEGLIVIAVVVAYETVRRWGLRRQQQRVGEELARTHQASQDKVKKEVPV